MPNPEQSPEKRPDGTFVNASDWDTAAEALGVNLRDYNARQVAALKLGQRPFGPSKNASPRCESGKRDYCTCDTCF